MKVPANQLVSMDITPSNPDELKRVKRFLGLDEGFDTKPKPKYEPRDLKAEATFNSFDRMMRQRR